MKKLSRHMPKAKQYNVISNIYIFYIALILLLLLLLGTLASIVNQDPKPFLLILPGTCLLMLASRETLRKQAERRQEIMLERNNDNIGTFAKSFDTKTVDTWVIRAVYEEIGRFTGFPIRPEDNLNKDLDIDTDDIEMDAMHIIAERTGRSLENSKQNPYYAKVLTVRDLVMFFNAQERPES